MDWHVWSIIGLGLLVMEILVPAFFFCWFGIGAFVVAAAHGFGMEALSGQLVLFSAVSIGLALASRTLFRQYLLKGSPGAAVRTNVDALSGQVGVVLQPVGGHGEAGQVKLGGMEWSARTDGGETLAAGARVRVVRVDGVHLVVARESGSTAPPAAPPTEGSP